VHSRADEDTKAVFAQMRKEIKALKKMTFKKSRKKKSRKRYYDSSDDSDSSDDE